MPYIDINTKQEYASLHDYQNQTGVILPTDPSDQLLAQLGIVYKYNEPVVMQPPVFLVKAGLLNQLNEQYLHFRESEATLDSSLGFKVDANERALADVGGLVDLGDPNDKETTIPFMDANNEVHPLTHDQLLVLKKEIIANGLKVYQQKWAIRDKIMKAQTVEELKEIQIEFK